MEVFEPRHDKTNKVSVRPAKTQISLGIRPIWSESSLCAQWVAKGQSFLHADREDSDQNGRMSRLIWVFAGRTLTLLILSCRGSFNFCLMFLFASLIEFSYRVAFLSFKEFNHPFAVYVYLYCVYIRWLNICISREIPCLIIKTKVNIKVQGVSQSQAAANPWHQEEEKKDKSTRAK